MHAVWQHFGVSMISVTFVFPITLWMRLLGATASCWVGDRIGRKKPLMVAILGYSLCNLAAGLAAGLLEEKAQQKKHYHRLPRCATRWIPKLARAFTS